MIIVLRREMWRRAIEAIKYFSKVLIGFFFFFQRIEFFLFLSFFFFFF